MAVTNYFAAESLIIERLKEQIKGVKVISTADIDAVEAQRLNIPIIHVMYAGDVARATEVYHNAIYKPEQQWLVVLSMRDVRKPNDGQQSSAKSGEYLVQIITALSGYRLSQDHSNLILTTGIRPQYSNGFAHYPIQFNTRVTV